MSYYFNPRKIQFYKLDGHLKIDIPPRHKSTITFWYLLVFTLFQFVITFPLGFILNPIAMYYLSDTDVNVDKGLMIFFGFFFFAAWLFAMYKICIEQPRRLWNSGGWEYLEFSPEYLTQVRQMKFIKREKVFERMLISDLQIRPTPVIHCGEYDRRFPNLYPNPNKNFGIRMNPMIPCREYLIIFKYDEKFSQIGVYLEEEEAKEIFKAIRKYSPSWSSKTVLTKPLVLGTKKSLTY